MSLRWTWPVLFSSAVAWAQDAPPADATSWAAAMETAYPHYAAVDYALNEVGRVWPVCPPADLPPHIPPVAVRSSRDAAQLAAYTADPVAFRAGCESQAHESWLLRVALKPVDQRVFMPLHLRIWRVPDGADPEAILREAAAHGAQASKANEVLVPIGRYLVAMDLQCGMEGMLPYESADLIGAVRAAVSAADPPAVVAWSRCGQVHYVLRPAADVLDEATQPREYFGLDFPETRDRTRAR